MERITEQEQAAGDVIPGPDHNLVGMSDVGCWMSID